MGLTSLCEAHLLEIRKQYLSSDYLASEQIDTPDPRRSDFCGEELLIRWKAPFKHGRPLFLHLCLFFANWQREERWIPLSKCVGYFHYRLLGDDFCIYRDIVAYKAELYSEDELLEQIIHPLYADKIESEKP